MWDIFCNVIDNYGDIGVCWRLARQLADEHGLAVRLWVDDLDSFHMLCPQADPKSACQEVAAVEIRRWEADFPGAVPGEVVVEAFGCRIPDGFVVAMASRNPRPVWINLEYLSAEDWVGDCHALPSPHPRLPLTKYFFFPGFTAGTGGVLREGNLLARRQAFEDDSVAQGVFWRESGAPPPAADVLRVSLFAYANPAIASLLALWANGESPVCCLVPVSRALATVESYCGQPLQAGNIVRRGNLELRVLTFVEQSRYDHLLWACDLNFVRGEDSFVRAQWAAKPMVWHIYPQEERAHLAKLDAFLRLYCAAMPDGMRAAIESFWYAWNAGAVTARQWVDFSGCLAGQREQARAWSDRLAEQKDLSNSLVRFCRSKV